MNLKTYIISCFLATCFFITGINAQETVVKTCCMSAIEFKASEDELKSELLSRAKKMAIEELFGEWIASYSKVENNQLTVDEITAISGGFIRIKGNPVYKNGDNFGEACVTIEAYCTGEDRDKLKPVRITGKHCLTDPHISSAELKQQTTNHAILSALYAYEPKLKTRQQEELLLLVHHVKYPENTVDPHTGKCCVAFEGTVYPLEIMALSGTKPKEKIPQLSGSWSVTSPSTGQYNIPGYTIIRHGSHLILQYPPTNRTFTARLIDSKTIKADNGNTGYISENGNRIDWSDQSFWIRE